MESEIGKTTPDSERLKRSDERIAFVAAVHLVLPACKNMLVGASSLAFAYNDILNAIVIGVLLVLYVRLLFDRTVIGNLSSITVLIIICCFMFFALAWIHDNRLFVDSTFPYNYVKSQLQTFLMYSLPLFMLLSMMRDYDHLLNNLLQCCPVLFVFASIAFVCSLVPSLAISESRTIQYSMGYGNAVLLLSLLLLLKMRRRKTPLVIVAFILSVVYILLSGSRGPLLSIGIAMVVLLMMEKGRKKIIISLVVLTAFVFATLFYTELLSTIIEFLESRGISSRTLVLMLSDQAFYDSGRSDYYSVVVDRLNECPLTGLGAFSGEVLVGLTHSLYLDIFVTFGYFIGGLLIAWSVISAVKLSSENSSRGELALLISITVFPRGFFSGSFFTSKELWMLFGMKISDRINRNQRDSDRRNSLAQDLRGSERT
ncbi:O-antigen ligase family protein [Adlercreutzia sp. ZJ141]|uniref:O-antigen ligase family protein n=1 Tax=Adlercreutzia sp. ZJ141 TaxID=2709406 RepID=UPI0013EA378B|nr:O-antigen ligase family protein [Adlercreutzia sp. ZJ141]